MSNTRYERPRGPVILPEAQLLSSSPNDIHLMLKKIALPFIVLLQACAPDPTTTEPYQQLEEDQRRTQQTVVEKDSTINELFGTFNRISENLRTIRAKQGGLVPPGGGMEAGADMEQRIMDDLAQIDALLMENKELIAKLRKQAKGSASRLTELERTIMDLESTIGSKNAEIDSLKEQLSSANSSLATLIDMYRDKAQMADMQRGELNSAHYLIGTAKELKEKGVLTQEGGVVGIGRVNKLNMSRLQEEQFTMVDITATPEIALGAKKAKLATSHPQGSYRLDGGSKLIITDAEKFWSVSKYLVVVVEN